MCAFILLVAVSAGTIHICEFGLRSAWDGYSAYDATNTGHAFCAICALAHSPSVLTHQISLFPVSHSFQAYSAAPAVHASLSQILAFRIRPPPLF